MAKTHGSEQYLKAIYILQAEGQTVIAARLAELLGISAPTVSSTLRRLTRDGFIEESADRGIRLTPEGRAYAESIVRRHRLLERWLTDKLGLDWATADEEADRLEHAVSSVVEERLDALLGYPATCPHGNPIPGNAVPEPLPKLTLDQVPAGTRVRVQRITEQAEEVRSLLQFLGERGMYPGVEIEVLDARPFAGAVSVRRDGEVFTLARETATYVCVRPV